MTRRPITGKALPFEPGNPKHEARADRALGAVCRLLTGKRCACPACRGRRAPRRVATVTKGKKPKRGESRYPELAQQLADKCKAEDMGWGCFATRYGISVRILGSLSTGKRVSPQNRERLRVALASYVPPWEVCPELQHAPIAGIVARVHAEDRERSIKVNAAVAELPDVPDITDEQWDAFDRDEAAAALAAAAPSLPMEGVTIDEQLRRAMGKDERSLRVIATAADIPHVSLYDWTKGKGRLPLTYADRLARVLGFELVLQRVPGETP